MASMYHNPNSGRPPPVPFPPPPPLQQQLPPPPPQSSSFHPNSQYLPPPPPLHQSFSQQHPPPPYAQPPIPFNPPPIPQQNYIPNPPYPPPQQPQKSYAFQQFPVPPPQIPNSQFPQPPPLPPSQPGYFPPSQFPQFPPPPASPPPPPPPASPPPPQPLNPPPSRVSQGTSRVKERPKETEEERRMRKKREYEKLRQEEKQRRLKEAQKAAGAKAAAAARGAAERKAAFVAAERGVVENRLKKPTTFLCKLKFRNELPDPTAQPKLLPLNTNKDRYTQYSVTSLEKSHKPKLFVEPDLGIPLDLLDNSVYNPRGVKQPLDLEDEELLRDDDIVTPIKKDGIRIKDRPTDKGVAWLVKTQYISPISLDAAKLSLTEKQAKELKENKEGRHLFLENLNNREMQIQAIEESFRAAKAHPVHQTKAGLQPVEILPLLPDFYRYEDRFLQVNFDSDPTADSETFSKLNRDIRDELESKAVMKSFTLTVSETSKSEKFMAYMAPEPEEAFKEVFDEDDEMSYAWVREYHWDLRTDDAEGPLNYLVHFEEDAVKYLPLPQKLVLQKKKAKEGRSTDDVETHYPIPSKVTVRKNLAAEGNGHTTRTHSDLRYVNSKERDFPVRGSKYVINDDQDRRQRISKERDPDPDQYSADEMSE